ncbi:hypothetical protein BDF20DRAFT_873525 [Mycotypha africana]|uniref:uncharacterized protein n=1 Tax=Mycotypha africana TaxID=64632 RepID=UPI002301A001|nr:uncharacterized protein BDF20DRAFT_873525 [Mycotypha africana]KAI8977200.1 hypothetical protein BDF20DRAFT_873525 [Mycotypha africana]
MPYNSETFNPSANCAFCHKKIDLQKSAFAENEKCGHKFHSRCVSTVAEPDPCPECALKEPSTLSVREEEPAPINADMEVGQSNNDAVKNTEPKSSSHSNNVNLDEAEINHLHNRAAEIQEEKNMKNTLL